MIDLLSVNNGRMPTTQQQYDTMVMKLRQMKHSLERSPGNIHQTIQQHRNRQGYFMEGEETDDIMYVDPNQSSQSSTGSPTHGTKPMKKIPVPILVDPPHRMTSPMTMTVVLTPTLSHPWVIPWIRKPKIHDFPMNNCKRYFGPTRLLKGGGEEQPINQPARCEGFSGNGLPIKEKERATAER